MDPVAAFIFTFITWAGIGSEIERLEEVTRRSRRDEKSL